MQSDERRRGLLRPILLLSLSVAAKVWIFAKIMR